MRTVALVIFILTYIFLLLFPRFRALTAGMSAALFLALGILTPLDAFFAVDWNVLLMLIGMTGIVSLFIDSKMPARLADAIMNRAPNVCWAIVLLSLFAGAISTFVDNVATVLIMAPIGLAISRRLMISPVPVVIAISLSCNLQGAAMLVGDTTSLLLGSHAGMDFLDFIFMGQRLGIFWAVEIGAVSTIFVLLHLFRRYKNTVIKSIPTHVASIAPTVLLCGTALSLALTSFIKNKPPVTNGLICIVFCLIGFLYTYLKEKNGNRIKAACRSIDPFTLILLGGLFVVIDGITRVGIIEGISSLFIRLGGNNLFILYSLIVWSSILLSAFIDNIPYVATMLPVVTSIAATLGIAPHLLYFGLLIGATLGGNLTPIGASSNIAGIGILQKEGYSVDVKDYLKLGVPFTLSAAITGSLVIWFIWAF